jgi:polyhydroxybutyrate depolymerase
LSGLTALELDVGGTRRRALLHLPPTPRPALPLVVMLHGAGATAAIARQQTGWTGKADAEGFAVVFPEGTPRDPASAPLFRLNPQLWNDGSGRGHVARRGVDDVGFFAALIERLARELRLERRRIHVTGFSNGASLAFRLGAELANVVAAVAPVAGHCWIDPPRLVRPGPLLHIAGAEDPLNPLEGGEVETPWGHSEYHPPVRRSIERWAASSRCAACGDRTDDAGVVWTECRCEAGTEVRLAIVPDLGHVWPGGPRLLPERLVGQASRRLMATDVIWDFFSRWPLRAPA